ncbi:unnamed protein product [Peniophora sp. CBMAI 1063]|nr:unnamed protein product [Peniophora sp. CBMAI 1063]
MAGGEYVPIDLTLTTHLKSGDVSFACTCHNCALRLAADPKAKLASYLYKVGVGNHFKKTNGQNENFFLPKLAFETLVGRPFPELCENLNEYNQYVRGDEEHIEDLHAPSESDEADLTVKTRIEDVHSNSEEETRSEDGGLADSAPEIFQHPSHEGPSRVSPRRQAKPRVVYSTRPGPGRVLRGLSLSLAFGNSESEDTPSENDSPPESTPQATHSGIIEDASSNAVSRSPRSEGTSNIEDELLEETAGSVGDIVRSPHGICAELPSAWGGSDVGGNDEQGPMDPLASQDIDHALGAPAPHSDPVAERSDRKDTEDADRIETYSDTQSERESAVCDPEVKLQHAVLQALLSLRTLLGLDRNTDQWPSPALREAAFAIMRYLQDVVCVTPLGPERALVIASLCKLEENSLAVVFVPNHHLVDVWTGVLSSAGIHYLRYDAGCSIDSHDVRVLLAPLNSANSDEMASVLAFAQMRFNYSKRRIVIEEILYHACLGVDGHTDTYKNIRALFHAQIIAFSSYLPEVMEGHIQDSFGLLPWNNTLYTRMIERRSNVQYSIYQPTDSLSHAVAGMISHYRERPTLTGKLALIVYMGSWGGWENLM